MDTQVISWLRTFFQMELPLRKFFETPTIFGVALVVTQSREALKEAIISKQLLAELDQLLSDEVDLLLDDLLAEEEAGK